jgi:16S rRNA (adenine1518-N6/adenine1519-N6)-dimethyltransferase
VARVPAAAFEPEPDVDSAVLRLLRRDDPPVPSGPQRETLYRVVQAGFRQRRKQIHNGLGRELPIERAQLEAALGACGVDPERRPQTLSVDEWRCLAAEIGPLLS